MLETLPKPNQTESLWKRIFCRACPGMATQQPVDKVLLMLIMVCLLMVVLVVGCDGDYNNCLFKRKKRWPFTLTPTWRDVFPPPGSNKKDEKEDLVSKKIYICLSQLSNQQTILIITMNVIFRFLFPSKFHFVPEFAKFSPPNISKIKPMKWDNLKVEQEHLRCRYSTAELM